VAKLQDIMAEEDLSQIGDGIPTVVQIHDPPCSQCLALQREAQAAMSKFGGGEIRYVVANIRQSSGPAFAAKLGVAHVTLMIFDAEGKRKLTLRGQNSRTGLSELQAAYIESAGASTQADTCRSGAKRSSHLLNAFWRINLRRYTAAAGDTTALPAAESPTIALIRQRRIDPRRFVDRRALGAELARSQIYVDGD